MDVKEIQALINVREYVNQMINNYNRSKSEVVDLRAMLILIDDKVVSMLMSSDFKDYVNFDNARAAIQKAASNNDIKSGMKKPQ